MKLLRLLLICVMAVGLCMLAYAAETPREAKVLDMEGSVEVRTSDGKMEPAEVGMVLGQGDIIKTGEDSFALVKLEGAETATVEVNKNSQILLSQMVMDQEKGTQSTVLDLAIGKVLIKAEKVHSDKSKFEVKTPTSVVGVRGTTFQVEVEGLE